MILYGNTPPAEVLFAVRMIMVKHNLSPSDIMKVLAALDKEKPPRSGGFSKGAGAEGESLKG